MNGFPVPDQPVARPEDDVTIRQITGAKLGLRMAGIVVALIGLVCIAITAVIAVVWVMSLWGHYVHQLVVTGFNVMDHDTRCFLSGAVLTALLWWWLSPNYEKQIKELDLEVKKTRLAVTEAHLHFSKWARGEGE